MRKIKISESQMTYLMEQGRLDFIKNQLNVISPEEEKEIIKAKSTKIKKAKPSDIDLGSGEQSPESSTAPQKNVEIKKIMSPEGKLLAVVTKEENGKVKVRPSNYVFQNSINADPTPKKVYVQWILTTFINLLKHGEDSEAIRFIDEDLPQANEYLGVFEKVKGTKLFRQSSQNIQGLPADPTNINQYKDLSQLYSAVDPFIEREEGELESNIKKYVAANRAKVVYQDKDWLVYIPLDRDANCVMGSYASWCTAREGNSNFDNYTRNYKEPDGSNSKIYVIINKDVLKGKSNEVYQFHFETDQYKDRTNGSNINFYSFMKANPGLESYFKKVLTELSKKSTGDLSRNSYIRMLIQMGEVDNLFDFFDPSTTDLNLSIPGSGGKSIKLPKLPDEFGRFKNVTELLIMDVGLTELPPSVGELTNLEVLSISKNDLTSLPETIGNLTNLQMLVMNDNPLKDLPDSLKNLSMENGGSLFRVSVTKSVVSDVVIKKLNSWFGDIVDIQK